MLRLTSALCLFFLAAPPATAQGEIFTIQGDTVDDQFGRRMRRGGDIDGDGHPDFLITSNSGIDRVNVISGSTQTVLYGIDISLDGFLGDMDGVGDLDGDGHDDFAMGEIGFPATGITGVVRTFSGATGSLLYTLSAPDFGADFIGGAVRSCADLDGDGLRDLLVQSRPSQSQVDNAVMAFSGASGGLLFQINSPDGESQFADAIASLGDIDGDGVGDFAVSDDAYFLSGGGTGDNIRGRVLVYSGANQSVAYEVLGNSLTFTFARTMAAAGDLDGDGVTDLLIGSLEGSSTGLVQVVSGASGAEIFRFFGELEDDNFGLALSRGGDVDGDGTEDILIGAPGFNPFFANAGTAYVYSGATGAELFRVQGEDFNLLVGASMAPAGDVDGDGLDDVLVGRPQPGPPAQEPGEVTCYGLELPSVRIDFELDDDLATPLENGAQIDLGLSFGILLKVSVFGPNQFGAATFDSSPTGPNAAGPSRELLVDQGNLVILQGNPDQSSQGTFDVPEASVGGGTLRFDLLSPGTMEAIDLVALSDPSEGALVRVIDTSGRVRTFDVPGGFTSDALTDPTQAVETLSLTSLAAQTGFAATATASEDLGFEPELAIALEVVLDGAAGVDCLVFGPSNLPNVERVVPLYSIPEPPLASAFGADLRSVGDVDRDGRDDFVVGSSAEGVSGIGVGRVFSGGTGALLATIEATQAASSFSQACCGIGDVDGDGVPDLALGGWLFDGPGGADGGVVRAYSGADFGLLYEVVGQPGDQLGVDLDSVGDHDGDGVPDWAVGSSGADNFRGRIEVRSGVDGGVLLTIPGTDQFARLGTDLRNAGDVNGDGLNDLVAYEEGGGPISFAGHFVVFDGADGSILFERFGTQQMQFLGAGSMGAGDVNGDGFDDILFADSRALPGPLGRRGRLQVLAGPDGSVLHEIVGSAPFSMMPRATGSAGDQDGDGLPDFYAVEEFDPPGPAAFGRRLRVFSGRTAGPLFERVSFISRMTPVGDFNGDGLNDLLALRGLGVEALSIERINGSVLCYGAPNSTGKGSRLYTNGQFAASANALELTVTNLPPRSLTLLISSPAYGFTPMPGVGGNPSAGALCVDGGPIVRHSFAGIGSGGATTFAVDLGILPGGRMSTSALAGQVQVFQSVYRDLAGPGQTNLSDAILIRFE